MGLFRRKKLGPDPYIQRMYDQVDKDKEAIVGYEYEEKKFCSVECIKKTLGDKEESEIYPDKEISSYDAQGKAFECVVCTAILGPKLIIIDDYMGCPGCAQPQGRGHTNGCVYEQ